MFCNATFMPGLNQKRDVHNFFTILYTYRTYLVVFKGNLGEAKTRKYRWKRHITNALLYDLILTGLTGIMINFTKSGCSRLRYPWRYTVNCRQTCREQTSGRRGAKGSKEGIIFCKPLFLFPGSSCRREQTKGDLRLPGYLSYPARESSLPRQRHSSHVGAKSALPMIQSGLKLSPDWCLTRSKEGRIGLRS